MPELPSAALLTFSLYGLAVASPGPSNLAVMATAMKAGRRSALIFALGVVAGSAVWGVLAALGLSALLARVSHAMVALKVLGGLYLLWLAFKSARGALSAQATLDAQAVAGTGATLFARGLAMHLTNPKAILTWMSLVSLALPPDAPPQQSLLIVGGCVPISLTIFGGYALLFSTRAARAAYLRSRRWIDGSLAALFGYAGVRMLLARSAG